MRPRQLVPPNVGTGSELGKGGDAVAQCRAACVDLLHHCRREVLLMEMSIGVHTIFLHGVYNMICTASGSNQKVNSPRIIYKLRCCRSADSDGVLEF